MVNTTTRVKPIQTTALSMVRRPGVRWAACASSPTKLVTAIQNQSVAMMGKASFAMSMPNQTWSACQLRNALANATTVMTSARIVAEEIFAKGP